MPATLPSNTLCRSYYGQAKKRVRVRGEAGEGRGESEGGISLNNVHFGHLLIISDK